MGIAFEANIMIGRTEESATETIIEEDNYIAAVEWGEKIGADMISSSLGIHHLYTYELYCS